MTAPLGAYSTGSDAATGTRPKSEVRRRTHDVHVRLDDDEHAAYAALATEKGMSLPELMRLGVDVVLIHERVREVAACSVSQVGDREWWCSTHGRNAEDCDLEPVSSGCSEQGGAQ